MPYSMAHPNYRYHPRTAEQRRAQSLRARRRLGIPSDCVQIYGIHVPAQLEWPLRQYASWLRQKSGLEAAVSFVRKAIDLNGRIAKPSPDKILKTDPRYVYAPRPSTVERLRQRQWRRASVELRRGIRAAYQAHRFGVAETQRGLRQLRQGIHAAYRAHCATLRLASTERRELARRLRSDAKLVRHGMRQLGRGIRAAYQAHRATEKAWQQRLRNFGRGVTEACRAQSVLAKTIARFAKFFGRGRVRQSTDWMLVDALLSEYATREEVASFLGISEQYLRTKIQQRKRDGLSDYSGRKGYA